MLSMQITNGRQGRYVSCSLTGSALLESVNQWHVTPANKPAFKDAIPEQGPPLE